MLKARELADAKTRKELDDLLILETDPGEKVTQVKAIFNKLEVKDHSNRKIKECFEEGIKHLEAIARPASQKENLVEFAGMILLREK